MKNLLIALLILSSPFISVSQTNIFPANGNVGIGSYDPLSKLEVRGGNLLIKNLSNTDNESIPMITQSFSFGNYTDMGTSIRTFTESAGNNSYGLQFFTHESYLTGQREKLRISANGNVGIGITVPTEKLSVNGSIRAKEIKVEVANWPDYVFEEGYELMSLQALGNYIASNKKLPEVPSAAVAERDGIGLAAMNKLLLKKIEELTLYLVRQAKVIENHEERFRMLEELKKNN